MRPEYRVRPLLLLLAVSVALLTTVQCLTPLARAASRIPTLVNLRYESAPHTREEVGDKGIDLTRDARRECTHAPATEPPPAFSRAEFVVDAEVEVTPPRQILHRRISPSSPDDAFPAA
jgi:hypothetical protein